MTSILEHYHKLAYGGHFSIDKKVKKVWQSGINMPESFLLSVSDAKGWEVFQREMKIP